MRKLVDARGPLAAFLDETAALGSKRHVILVQLPPSLAYDPGIASAFFESLQSMYDGNVVFEPRHASWFCDDVDAWLSHIGVARVAADPAPVRRAATPGGSTHMAYYRLHGSPRMYYSAYDDDTIAALARKIGGTSGAWCIFDNTAGGAAAPDALRLVSALRHDRGSGASRSIDLSY